MIRRLFPRNAPPSIKMKARSPIGITTFIGDAGGHQKMQMRVKIEARIIAVSASCVPLLTPLPRRPMCPRSKRLEFRGPGTGSLPVFPPEP